MDGAVLRVAAGLVLGVAGSQALADFTGPGDYGWSRGDANSTYFEWDYFSSSSGGNVPDVGQFPDPLPEGWTAPDVVETTGNGFVTGSGNIYSPFGPTSFDITVPNYNLGSGSTTVLLQIRTQGTELDYPMVNLGGDAPVDTVELYREDLGDFGFLVDTLFVFEVSGNASEYLITAPSVESSMSLDKIAVDTFVDTACAADFNGDGSVDTRDVISYLNAWSIKDGSADTNGDGVVDTRDFIAYLNLWTTGC
ncbi:MAG: hypothetical protein IPJ41_09655 [Phycisphaerales bacterium]|nr:hypothetical protein [Phycisphaerales bacterium]